MELYLSLTTTKVQLEFTEGQLPLKKAQGQLLGTVQWRGCLKRDYWEIQFYTARAYGYTYGTKSKFENPEEYFCKAAINFKTNEK